MNTEIPENEVENNDNYILLDEGHAKDFEFISGNTETLGFGKYHKVDIDTLIQTLNNQKDSAIVDKFVRWATAELHKITANDNVIKHLISKYDSDKSIQNQILNLLKNNVIILERYEEILQNYENFYNKLLINYKNRSELKRLDALRSELDELLSNKDVRQDTLEMARSVIKEIESKDNPSEQSA